MKKIIYLFIVAWFSLGGTNLSFHYGASWKQSDEFKNVYGREAGLVGLSLDRSFKKTVFLYGGYDYLNTKGETLVFKEQAETTHHYFSLGLGYAFRIINGLQARLKVGAVYVKYREKALGETVEGSCPGFEFSGGIRYRLGRFFIESNLGYLIARDILAGEKVVLDGLKGNLGIGVSF